MKTKPHIILTSLFVLVGLMFLSCKSPQPGNVGSDWPDRSGIYEYSAFYEEGSKAGTQSHGHKMKLSLEKGEYILDWGGVQVKGVRVADGLIYKWASGRYSGQGIYVLYDNATKLTGTFWLVDDGGEQRGYTQGVKKSP
ncbi:MAG: hypothetical protein IMZ61_09285 [Planctomycetes bacterium]|nr:hypothetical protein [Planctomycetota bacterium]